MEKLLTYIAGGVQIHEHAIKRITNALKNQSKINKCMGLLVLVGGAYIYLNEAHDKKLVSQLETLSKEVEELKKMKGE